MDILGAVQSSARRSSAWSFSLSLDCHSARNRLTECCRARLFGVKQTRAAGHSSGEASEGGPSEASYYSTEIPVRRCQLISSRDAKPPLNWTYYEYEAARATRRPPAHQRPSAAARDGRHKTTGVAAEINDAANGSATSGKSGKSLPSPGLLPIRQKHFQNRRRPCV
jgi:hypothetical protein